ncbi:MAG: hypothetical protein LBJ67_11705 [Planctomycetaceae bacterium]|jgi:hypothetical protein|nr:hypothetical protein [Planctomycetaceae bacterium]
MTVLAEDLSMISGVTEKTNEKMMLEYEVFVKTISKKDFYKRNTDIDYTDDINNINKTVDEFFQLCFQMTRDNITKLRSFKKTPHQKNEKDRFKYANEILGLRQTLVKNIDKNFDFSIPVFRNIHAPGYMSGGDPNVIQNLEERKKYEEALWKNSVNSFQIRIQRSLIDCDSRLTKALTQFFIDNYAQIPRADDELIELLEKYEYPEEEKVKIFEALNIPYKGFREWQTNDGLLTLTAKLISADTQEIKIEKEDGKQFTIEISYLRKEDQDYVKKQLESEKKTPEGEKTKN